MLYFHNADYFAQPIFNYCFINIKDMLDNGTVINGKMIESPKSFQVACIVMTQIITTAANNQYGGQFVDLIHLGKYLRISKEKFKKELTEELGENADNKLIETLVNKRLQKEVSAGIQIIQYQINTLMTTNGKSSVVTLLLHIDPKDEYLKENIMIIEEVLKQRLQGMKNFEGEYITPILPKLIYVIDEFNCLKGGKYDYLTKLAIECSKKRNSPSYISSEKLSKVYDENLFENKTKFNQGIVTINLPQIGIVADGDEEKFWKELDLRLDICKEALMCRYYALYGTPADISPVHWRYGAIARLERGEKIDKLLYQEYSTISLGYVGLYELTKLMKGTTYSNSDGQDFAYRVLTYLKEIVLKWRKETNIGFILEGINEKEIRCNFANIDKEKFGIIENITDKGYYSGSYYVDDKEECTIWDKLKIENKFQKLLGENDKCHINTSNVEEKDFDWERLVRFIYDNTGYIEIK